MTQREARRLCATIFFHAGPNRQRLLLNAISNDLGYGIPPIPCVIGAKTEHEVEETYADFCEICSSLEIQHEMIIERGLDGRFYPGELTRLAHSPAETHLDRIARWSYATGVQ